MQRLHQIVNSLSRREEGQDLLEYGLLVALIAIVAVTTVGALGQKINTSFWQLIVHNL